MDPNELQKADDTPTREQCLDEFWDAVAGILARVDAVYRPTEGEEEVGAT